MVDADWGGVVVNKRVIEHELIGLHQVCDRVPSCTVQAPSGVKHTGSDALLIEPWPRSITAAVGGLRDYATGGESGGVLLL